MASMGQEWITGHAGDAAFSVPNTLLPLHVETFFREHLRTDPAANTIVGDLIEIAEYIRCVPQPVQEHLVDHPVLFGNGGDPVLFSARSALIQLSCWSTFLSIRFCTSMSKPSRKLSTISTTLT